MVNIKVVHKENLRRFTLPSNATWIELEAKLRSLFSIPALTPFTLSYTDEDNDVITLSTDIELQEILSSSPTIKFNLKFSTSDDSSDSEDEVWVFEGRNIPPHNNSDKNSSTDSGLQDNVTRSNNITSNINQEPQYIDIDSRDEKKVPMSFSDDDFERVNPLNKKTSQISLSDEDYECVKPLDKKIILSDEDYEVGKSLDKKISLSDEDCEVGKSLGVNISLSDEDCEVGKEVGRSLGKKNPLLDEDYDDYDLGKSSNKKTTLLNEVHEVEISLKNTSLSDDDHEVGKSLKNTSLLDDNEVGKSSGKKAFLLDEDHEVGKSFDKKPPLFDDSFDSFTFRPNLASKNKPKPKFRYQPQRSRQTQKETIGASPPNNTYPFTSLSEQQRRLQEQNIQTSPVVDLADRNLTVPNTFATPPMPIPGAFPTRPKPSTPVAWAGKTPPEHQKYGGGRVARGARGIRGSRGGRGGRGKNRNQNHHHYHHLHPHHHNEFSELKEGTSGGEEIEELELSEGEEPLEPQDPSDLQILYPAQIEKLSGMGFKEEEYVESLINFDGDIERVIDDLLNRQQL